MKRAALLCAALAAALAAPAAAQFGKNRVQYRTFAWNIIQTEHFDIYFYPAEREAALDAARMAERSYARLSRVLHHQFQERKPIILYASHSEFQQTNALGPEDVSEATLGVTEFFKHRMVLPFMGSYGELAHVIQHEMVHQFQYDVYSHGRPGAGLETLMQVQPPGWFMEGMAEYLSVGPIDPETAMWLRDASLEGHLPTIEDLTNDPSLFPYRYGHAIWAYIGERWGDEVIGEILQASAEMGIPGAFKRALGISLDELSQDWHDAVQATFLPQIGDHYRARRIAQTLLTEKRSGGTIHLAPALSPDGKYVAYFSEGNDFFIDLYLADAETGHVIRRLLRSVMSNNYESLRFIYSSGSWSPDGRYFAIAVKHEDRDDLVILDIREDKEVARLHFPLNGITNPSWSSDGKRLVFTGYDGGLSDLFIVNRDGTGLRRLTNDKYADVLPVWSPDGSTIAFATDRGPDTDFRTLKIGNMRIALYHLDSDSIEVLNHMDYGNNVDPVWAPDGKSLAFVSDRSGISNIYLYDFGDREVYQLTDVFTGVEGITTLSPALSWAHQADRLAFVYYEDGNYDVYAIDNPRGLKRQPYPDRPVPTVTLLLQRPGVPADTGIRAAADTTRAPAAAGNAVSMYRGEGGLRQSGARPTPAESVHVAPPVSIRQLLDSAAFELPDTSEFTIKPYRVHFTPDYVARPTIGYERDNFGRGVFGGTAISLSDMLGDHTLIFSGAINGRIEEAEILAGYINQVHRTNWALTFQQSPYYFYEPSTVSLQPIDTLGDTSVVFTTNLRRYVIRDFGAQAQYPFSRFNRVEFGLHLVNVSDALLQVNDFYDPFGNYQFTAVNTVSGVSRAYAQGSAAYVHDNALYGYVGPLAGGRTRFEVSPAVGNWRFTATLADWRHYFFARPFTLAVRGLFFARWGRDGGLFPIFLGSTELIRGYTAGSVLTHECAFASSAGCPALDQLIGSRIAVANVELRFPLTRNAVFTVLPLPLPPIEGALFYDAGVAWNPGNTLMLSRPAGANPETVRAPLRSWGFGMRWNLFDIMIFRLDYTKPLNRPGIGSYWTLSLGPTF